MQKPQKQLEGVTVIQLDTENNHVELGGFQDYSSEFANQLVEILKQPFEPSAFESYTANFIKDNIWEKGAPEYL
jgi:hypothetical protein